MARCLASSPLVFWLCNEVANSGDVVTQKQRFAIFGTRAQESATPLSVFCPHRNQIFLGGHLLGARRSSPQLHRTSQQPAQAIMQNMYSTYIGGHQLPRSTFSQSHFPSLNLQNGHQSLARLMVGQGCSVIGKFVRHTLGKSYLKLCLLLCPCGNGIRLANGMKIKSSRPDWPQGRQPT